MLFFAGAGIVCILYYLVIIIYSGITSAFSWFWLMLGVFFECLFVVLRWMRLHDFGLPKMLYGIMLIFFIVVFLVFSIVEIKMIGTSLKKAQGGADYVIVLGASVLGDRPSKTLMRRVETAAGYLKDNQETKVIVSGGQGQGEDISEAECMKRLLLDMGIDKDRILKEDQSTDTYQNIKNSLKICGNDQKIVIVTCSFHMYRAQELAKKAGALHVEGISSPSDKILMINYYIREFFAVLKYKFCGQI